MNEKTQPISILLTSYNEERFILPCIQSISMDIRDIDEVIVVDDGSSDETPSILAGAEERFSWLKVIYLEENLGLAHALNVGLRYCTNQIVARMDADDVWLTGRLKMQLIEFENDPSLVILGANAIIIDDNNNNLNKTSLPIGNVQHVLKRRNPLIHPSVMFRKSQILSLGGYDVNLKRAQDFDLWLKAKKNGFKIKNIETPVIKYRLGRSFKFSNAMSCFLTQCKLARSNRSLILLIFAGYEFCKNVTLNIIYRTKL